ncbi:MAG: sigma-54 dependent transcriptional regulator [Gemmatimonadota bacterium]|nr:sigma-54-dependent Fis family transcriptional regulator [Gemmatimonadota bacterium]
MEEASATPRILIADDQPDVLRALRLLLEGEGFETVTATSPAGIGSLVEKGDLDAVLMDLNYARDTTSGREGLSLLPRLKAYDPTLPIVVMTAWGSVEGAVEAIRKGAGDYIEKPWDNARLLSTLTAQVELGRAMRRAARLEGENRSLRERDAPALIARSHAMQPVLRLIERVAPADATVLVTGPPGSGKEVVARRLHALSRRAERPLVAVNAGGLSETLFESEMFGHVKGAFTDARSDRVGFFEMADQGTLFLDEVGNLTGSQQAKLLRVLETGEFQRVGSSRTRKVDVRLLAATNADLPALVAEDRFREDLLYRLKPVEIRLPPLRDRREDIPLLAGYFLEQQARRYGRALHFSEGAMRALLGYPWPGNVRELRHAVERAVLLAERDTVEAEHLALETPVRPAGPEQWEDLTLDEAERVLIQKALLRFGGNVTQAAEALGLSRSALYRRLDRYDLQS